MVYCMIRTRIRRKQRYGCLSIAWRMTAIMLAILVYLLSTGCKSQKPVQLDEKFRMERERMKYRDSVRKDTIFVHDSVFVSVVGETKTVERWRTKYVERTKIDTLMVLQRDTVYSCRREVVKQELSFFDRLKTSAFWWLVLVIVVLLIINLLRKYRYL